MLTSFFTYERVKIHINTCSESESGSENLKGKKGSLQRNLTCHVLQGICERERERTENVNVKIYQIQFNFSEFQYEVIYIETFVPL